MIKRLRIAWEPLGSLLEETQGPFVIVLLVNYLAQSMRDSRVARRQAMGLLRQLEGFGRLTEAIGVETRQMAHELSILWILFQCSFIGLGGLFDGAITFVNRGQAA